MNDDPIIFDLAKGESQSKVTIHQGDFPYEAYTDLSKLPKTVRSSVIKCNGCGLQGNLHVYSESESMRECPDCDGEMLEVNDEKR